MAASHSFARSAAMLAVVIIIVTGFIASVVVLITPSLSVLALLAYSFGCRHGIDADHIAAIDNATRRLYANGQRGLTVGVWFSLGHCTIVMLVCIAVLAGVRTTSSQFEQLAEIGDTVGPWIAAVVLLTIGSLNLWAARDLWAQWRQREARGHEHEIASLVAGCCPALLEAVDRPSRVFWIGLLFGLGLDTATEIALLTTTAMAQRDLPRMCALVLPLLFASGMALVDSINAVLMMWAQEWATDNGPLHRLYFSLFLTVASAVLALGIGMLEIAGQLGALPMLRDQPFWETMRWPSEHLEYIGIGAVAAFLLAIGLAVLLAHRCVPLREECERDAQTKLRESLLGYVKGGNFIVRVE